MQQDSSLPTLLQTIVVLQPYPLVFATVSGAHLYGFPSADSDYDLRGVHLLSPSELFGLFPLRETIGSSKVIDGLELDLVTHDARKFFELMLRRNGYVLEQLFSPLIVYTTPEHEELVEIGKQCITRFHAFHYLGFSATQWKLFQNEEPPRVKPLLYVYRVLLTGIHLMQTGEIEANLILLNEHFRLPYLPELIERKVTGAEKEVLDSADIAFHQQEYLRLRETLEDAMERTTLPHETHARSALSDLLVRLRLSGIQES